MKTLRPLIKCGCTSDSTTRCVHRSAAGGGCLCPCHFTQEQAQRLISAYLHVGEGQIAGFIKNSVPKKTVDTAGRVVIASCGHESVMHDRPSKMAELYVRQHPCDLCREDR